LRRSLARSHPADSIVRKLYALVVHCLRQLGRPGQAAEVCREGLRVCPGDTELLFVDAVLRRDQGDLPGAEAALVHLPAPDPGAPEAALLRARAHLARAEFAPARALLGGLIAQAPQALAPRVLLSHALLQEGADPDATARALHAVLVLDPQHAEARHNLAVLA